MSTIHAMVVDHEHLISSILFATSSIFLAIATLAFLKSVGTKILRKVSDWSNGLRTVFVLNRGPHSLCYGHPDLLLY